MGGSIVLEFIQSMVNPSRVFDVNDIISNVSGSLTSLSLCWIYRIIKRRKRIAIVSVDLEFIKSREETLRK